MMFKVHFDIPDFLVHMLGDLLEEFTVMHATNEIVANGGKPNDDYRFRVSMLPDDPDGITNFSRVYFLVVAEFPQGFRQPWLTARYPGREDYERRIEKNAP